MADKPKPCLTADGYEIHLELMLWCVVPVYEFIAIGESKVIRYEVAKDRCAAWGMNLTAITCAYAERGKAFQEAQRKNVQLKRGVARVS